MHKRLVNHCTIDLSIIPDGPILIKSGKEGADPTKPDMEFVETYHAGGRSIYLPGSSLKGAIRAHAERIVRTVGREDRTGDTRLPWANDPLNDNYDYLKDKTDKQKKLPSHKLYKESSFTDQLFGNTAIASRIRFEDAYPDSEKPKPKLEERNGVAIDRGFGSVAVGPFNYQVCTAGEFRTKIHLKNFTLAQLGLIGLVLRDLNDGWFGLGFAKSRGLGTVKVKYHSAIVQYPSCELQDDQICVIGTQTCWSNTLLLGAGEFLKPDEAGSYGFPKPNREETPIRAQAMDLNFGVQLTWMGDTETGVPDLFMRSVRSWSQLLTRRAA
ncbi:MAG: CRISPR-associated protein [Leptolyngbyaceae cyanobacterium SU_3_3]|nr:CRISPR-associated protein [Leptolyngbyaceae cyanobacterium SU_3_3]